MPNDTDWYGLCEAQFMTNVRTLKQYFKFEYSVDDDDSVLSRGGDCFLIVRPGAFPTRPTKDMHEHDFLWEIDCDLFVRYTTYAVSWKNFKAVRKDLINLVYPNPYLDGVLGVTSVSLTASQRPQYFRLEEKAVKPNFIIQNLQAHVIQRVGFEF